MYQISFENIKIFGTKKPQTKKPKINKPRKLFYFQVRESPIPLNILTPTPAPDHLLGGHNELGGTSVE